MIEVFPRITLWSLERVEPLINQLAGDLEVVREIVPFDSSIVTTLHGKRTRVTRLSTIGFIAIGVSSSPDRVKSKKVMDREILTALLAAPSIQAATMRSEQRSRRLIHNLKSLTAKTSQEIFYLFQQDKMMASPREVVEYVANEVRQNPHETAKAIVEILKHQAAQKAEYSAFEKLSGKIESLRTEGHDVHRVLMNVFYLFFGSFVDKKVRAEVAPTRIQALFDYDSIHACIYYIVENAAKYTSPNSALNVTVTRDLEGLVDVRFDMESLIIKPDEQERIFEEGFSGENATRKKLDGAGIGLYLAREMALLNRGRLNLLAGRETTAGYARNTFVLTLRGIDGFAD